MTRKLDLLVTAGTNDFRHRLRLDADQSPSVESASAARSRELDQDCAPSQRSERWRPYCCYRCSLRAMVTMSSICIAPSLAITAQTRKSGHSSWDRGYVPRITIRSRGLCTKCVMFDTLYSSKCPQTQSFLVSYNVDFHQNYSTRLSPWSIYHPYICAA